MYDVLFSPAGERYLKRLKEKPLKDAYRAAFLAIMKDPYIGTQERGDPSGHIMRILTISEKHFDSNRS
jgi:mRNA interferase RelE/StbE